MRNLKLTFDSGEILTINTASDCSVYIGEKMYSSVQAGRLHKCIAAEKINQI